MNDQARAPNPSRARGLALARASTPVRSSIPVRIPAPARASAPARTRNPARIPTRVRAPNPAQTPTPVRAPNPAQTLTPARAANLVQTPTSAGTPTPVQAPASAWTPSLLQTPTPVQTPTAVWTRTSVQPPTLVQTPTSVGTSTPVRILAPVEISTRGQTPTPNWTPTQAGIPAPTSSPVGVPITAAVPASESFPNSASLLDSLSDLASEPAASPDKDLSRTPGAKHLPSVTNGFGSPQEPLPALAPKATDLLGPILGSTSTADPSAAKVMDSTLDFIPPPVLESDPFASTFTSTFENIPEDSKILIRVVYCYSLRYILLKRSLELQFPNCLRFEEERSVQASGEFEVFVDGKLVHSKKRGDGFVDEARLQKIMSSIHEEIRRKEVPQQDAEKG